MRIYENVGGNKIRTVYFYSSYVWEKDRKETVLDSVLFYRKGNLIKRIDYSNSLDFGIKKFENCDSISVFQINKAGLAMPSRTVAVCPKEFHNHVENTAFWEIDNLFESDTVKGHYFDLNDENRKVYAFDGGFNGKGYDIFVYSLDIHKECK